MKINKILENIPDKQYKWKGTTSLKWKKETFNFFKEKKLKNVLEIGTNQGWTSYLLSYLSENVYTIEFSYHNLQEAKKHCVGCNNINFIQGDAYSNKTYQSLPLYIDAVVIDCIHDYDHVIQDINRSLQYVNPNKGIYLIFDDYSHPQSTGVKKAIDTSIKEGLKFESYIGHNKGHIVNRNDGSNFVLNGPEGIILSYGK
tara:strand:- start:229 stop:828 length:600 start_codon:yes stop_codon:yes gene_type:complete